MDADSRAKENKTRQLGHRVTPTRHDEVTKFVDKRDWDMPKFLNRAVQESMDKVLMNEAGCKGCGNYIDKEFMNANCSGCRMNPFYMNCFTKKDK